MYLEAVAGFVVFACIVWVWRWKDCDPSTIPSAPFEYDIDAATAFQERVKDTKEKFLVIGAGFVGLGLANALKRKNIPFESIDGRDQIGGNWFNGVYNHVHILSSKQTTEMKDFPMPSDYPAFPSGTQMFAYLKSYWLHYQLDKQTSLQTEAKLVRPLSKSELEQVGEKAGKTYKELWEVHLSNGEKRLYKGVVICIGHHWDRRIPQYPGQDQFGGTILHSKDYKDPIIFSGKKVLVVGGGNSACDINVEAVRYGETVHSSMRRGYWFLPRTIGGIPLIEWIRPWMPMWYQRLVIRSLLYLIIGPYTKYGLQVPDHQLFEQHPTINTELLNYLKLGKIAPHPDIKCFHKNSVEFVDGVKADVDIVIFATGYHISAPFLEKGLLSYDQGIPQLINGSLLAKYRNFYFVGIAQPRYGAGPMITAGGEGLTETMSVQEKLRYPVGTVLTKIGAATIPKRNNIKGSLRNDVLEDPHAVYRRMKQAKWFVAKLPWIENVLLKFGAKFDV